MKTQYFRLDYFYSRKESGSFYIKLENENILDADLDEDAILELAVSTKQVDKSDIDNISMIESIEEDDFTRIKNV